MKHRFLPFFICLFYGLPFLAVGQWETGLSLGINYSTARFFENDAGLQMRPSYRPGIDIGLPMRVTVIKDELTINTGLFFTEKGYRNSIDFNFPDLSYTAEEDVRAYYLRIPLLVEFDRALGGGTLALMGGGFISLGLGGTYHQLVNVRNNPGEYIIFDGEFYGGVEFISEVNGDNILEVAVSDNIYLNNIDLGFSAAVQYRWRNCFLRLGYDYSLFNLAPPVNLPFSYSLFSRSNRSAFVRLGYYF